MIGFLRKFLTVFVLSVFTSASFAQEQLISKSVTIPGGQTGDFPVFEVPLGSRFVLIQTCIGDLPSTVLLGSGLGIVPKSFCTRFEPGVIFGSGEIISCQKTSIGMGTDKACLINGVLRAVPTT